MLNLKPQTIAALRIYNGLVTGEMAQFSGLIHRTNPQLEDCVICEAIGEPTPATSFDSSGYARCNQHRER